MRLRRSACSLFCYWVILNFLDRDTRTQNSNRPEPQFQLLTSSLRFSQAALFCCCLKYPLWQSIATVNPEDVFKLRRELEAIRTRIEELRDAIREHSATIRVAEGASAKAESAAKTVNAVVAYEAKTAKNANIEFRKQLRVQKLLTVGTWLAFVAAGIYAGIAAKQLTQMRKATRAATKAANIAAAQIVLDARPWINLIPGEGVPNSGAVPANTAIGAQFTISNPGKTAAVDLKWETFNILVHPGAFVEPRYAPLDPTWTTKMYPGNSSTPNVTLRGPTIHSAAENKLWQNRKLWEELAIQITYRDTVDVTHPIHTTEACIFVIWSNAANPQCPEHNYQN